MSINEEEEKDLSFTNVSDGSVGATAPTAPIEPPKKDFTDEILQTRKNILEFLVKKESFNIQFDDGSVKIFHRKPLSSKRMKEIEDLSNLFSTFLTQFDTKIKGVEFKGKVYHSKTDILFERYRLLAKFALGMSDEQFDEALWEDDPELTKKDIFGLRSILDACIMRTIHGIVYFHQPSNK